MLYKCANPGCLIRFRQLRRGKLFQIESEYLESPEIGLAASARKTRPLRRVERYWLCDECAACLTLTFDQTRGVVTVPLPDAGHRILTAVHLQQLDPSTTLARADHAARWGMRGSTWTS